MAFGETEKEEYRGSHDSIHIDYSPMGKQDTLFWDIHIDTDPVTIQKINAPDRDVWAMLERAGL